jgi:hypothetical protein
MNTKAGKGFTYIFKITALISSLAVPIFFVTCKKDDPPKVKSMNQFVVLINDVEIKYSTTLINVDNAELKVNKEGVLISSEEINVASTGADYEKTFSYSVDPRITKGNYEFTLTSDNLQKRDVVTIPNYKPTVNISGLNFSFTEDSETTISLPKPSDKNPEDNPVSIIGVKSSDGKTQPTLKATSSGYDLNVKALPNSIGAYQLELEFSSANGGLEKVVLVGNINKDTRIKIDPFVSTDSNGAEYNALRTKEERDNFIQMKLNADWTNTILSSTNPLWVCGHYARQLMTNSRDWGEEIKLDDGTFYNDYLFNGYKGRNVDTIKINGGTLYDMGKLALPMGIVGLTDTSHHSSPFRHAMNWIATKDYFGKWEDLNFIEPQTDATNVQIGGWDIPKDCDEVIINYDYSTKGSENYLKYVPLLKFRIENGNPVLIWENKDPQYNIIKQRGI